MGTNKVRAKKRERTAVGERVSEHELFFRAICWLLFGAFGGQLVQALPVYTDIWGAAGVAGLLLYSHFRHKLPTGLKAAAGVAVALFLVFSVVKGAREYTGANYPIYYEVCAAPTLPSGYVDSVAFAVELINPNDKSLWVHFGKHELGVEDHRSTLQAPDVTVELWPDKLGGENAKLDDRVDFDPPITPRSMSGQVHYEYRIGPDKDHLRRPFVIEGRFDLLKDPTDDSYQFRFTPTGSSGFDGYCDISRHLHDRTS